MRMFVGRLHVHSNFVGPCRLHHGCKLFVEVEVSSCGSSNEPCPATEGEILDCPLDKNQNAALELDYIHQMDERPYKPGRQSRHMHAKGISHRRPPANDGETAFIE